MPARPLLAVPDLAPGAVLYIRQSVTRRVKDAQGRATSELDTVSPEIQETAGRDYCQRKGYPVVAVVTDLNRTGRTLKRRKVLETIAHVERGDAQVIVVWKWSRLARNRRDFAVTCDMVEALGGRVESSTEPIDTSTAVGRFNRGVLAEFAAFESDRAGEVIREVYESRAKRGLPGNGKPRFGYRNVGRGVFEPDPELGPVLASMYRQYLAGAGYQTIARWLNDHGYRTTYGGDWRLETVRSVLDSGFGAGQFRHRGKLLNGAHKAVIEPDEWDQYLATRQRRAVTPSRAKGSRWLLTGLAKCGMCGYALAVRVDRRGVAWMQCRRRVLNLCLNRFVKVTVVEAEVMRWLAGVVHDVGKAAEAAAQVRRQLVNHRQRADVLVRRIKDQDAALTRLTVDRASGLVPEAAYVSARDEIQAVRQRLADEHAEATAGATQAAQVDVRAYRELLEAWDLIDVAARRELLGRILRRVLVWGRPFKVLPVPAWQDGEPSPGPGPPEDLELVRRRLLRDLREVFGEDPQLYTRTIIDRLCALPDSPWLRFNGHPVSAHDLARLLKPLGVASVDLREKGPPQRPARMGYRRADLAATWGADSI